MMLTGILSIPELHFLFKVDTISIISPGVVRYKEKQLGFGDLRYLENVTDEFGICEASVLPIETKYSLNLSAISCLFVSILPLMLIELVISFFISE